MYKRNNRLCTESTCCIESMGKGLDPMTIDGVIPAGEVQDEVFDSSCMLAKIYFPTQEYRAGFAPCEALSNGTMFPELVRLYK